MSLDTLAAVLAAEVALEVCWAWPAGTLEAAGRLEPDQPGAVLFRDLACGVITRLEITSDVDGLTAIRCPGCSVSVRRVYRMSTGVLRCLACAGLRHAPDGENRVREWIRGMFAGLSSERRSQRSYTLTFVSRALKRSTNEVRALVESGALSAGRDRRGRLVFSIDDLLTFAGRGPILQPGEPPLKPEQGAP